jgi:putative ABC transport system permease protein
VRAIPGVEAVGHARMVPLQGGGFALGGIRIPGVSDAVQGALSRTGWDVVSPGYFRAVGLPVLQGRAFGDEDRDGAPHVAIVNERFARIAWPDQSPIGRQFRQMRGGKDTGPPLEVVGVVQDARYKYVSDEVSTAVYVPFAQQPQTRVELFVKHAPGRSVATDVRAAVASAEPALPVVAMQSIEEAAAVSLLGQRVGAWIAGFVGLVGIFLAALGVYGLGAFLVAQRTREIGIRMSLGASRRDIRSLVLGQTLRLGLLGSSLGMLGAWMLGRLVQSLNLLVGVAPTDPLTFGTLAAFMSAVLLAASYAPARRAVATDPAAALRAQ